MSDYFQRAANKTGAGQFNCYVAPQRYRHRAVFEELATLFAESARDYRHASRMPMESMDITRIVPGSRGSGGSQARIRAIGTTYDQAVFGLLAAHRVGKRRSGYPSRGIPEVYKSWTASVSSAPSYVIYRIVTTSAWIPAEESSPQKT